MLIFARETRALSKRVVAHGAWRYRNCGRRRNPLVGEVEILVDTLNFSLRVRGPGIVVESAVFATLGSRIACSKSAHQLLTVKAKPASDPRRRLLLRKANRGKTGEQKLTRGKGVLLTSWKQAVCGWWLCCFPARPSYEQLLG